MHRPAGIATFRSSALDPAELVAHKRGRTISVCLPARNEEATVAEIVTIIRTELMERVALVDEIVVMDDHSSDRTADVAAAAGARVVRCAEVLTHIADSPGKGETLWKSVHAAEGDLIVWCDADVTNFGPHFVTGLAGPLLQQPELAYVKGFYERPVGDGQGGRVTELVARPLIALLHPQLAGLVQPLAGEYAGRRDVLERVPFVQGYGVEMGLLIDLVRLVGHEHLAQVDLGTRVHRNRPLDQLACQATEVMQIALRRAAPDLVDNVVQLHRPNHDPCTITLQERPRLVDVAAYVERRRDLSAGSTGSTS
ncbi:MAG: glucosyl-3-phosphoglycerate synthase [Acidimicrobiales bacterium]|nr:glucosyl-3-phosphoglycerate synthase [Acidimicrobiales bacterium]